ncbi:tripartite tricarboxylate transporter permease [Pseudooceanicola spongiae]|nr:tripartite tricarboxylate transporter permease [Pseudooceanicola spongiae]
MVDAFVGLFSTTAIFYLLFGACLGLVVGILPALGGAAGLSLLIPFIYGMEPSAAMAMVIGMLATVTTGDTITSVLLGIPGSASSQATILDGFPMAKSGQGARALSAGFLSSVMGGLLGAAVLTLTLQVARQIILLFGVPEILMMILFGVASVAALSGRSLAKGVAICAFGMIVASIGYAPATGEERLTFGMFYFADGLPLIACVIGVFVVPEIVDLVRQNRSVSDRPVMGSGTLQGMRDVLANKWLVVRSAGVGCLVGAMPGVGGAVVDWIVYGQTVRSAKDKSRFGQGDVRGVIGVESSNNAVLGGALVPTLLFGVPGSGSTALLLSALIMLGVQPGPSMLGADINLTYSMIWSLAIANIVGAGLCFLLARHLAKITMIPFVWIAPFLIVAISFATLQVNRDPRDLLLVLVFGAVGVFMRRFGFSRPAFLIGFVLQGNLERSFYQTSQLYDLWGFISRPIVLLLAVVVATVLINSLRKQLSTTVRFDTPEHEASLMATRPLQLLMPVMLAAVFGGALWILKDLQPLGRTFPEIVAGIGLVAALIAAVQILRKVPSSMEDQEQEGTEYPVSMLRVGGWLAAAMALLIAFGFFAGSALFLALFLGIEARARIWQIAAGIIGIVGLYLVLMFYSGTFLPDGWVLSLNPWTYF